MTHERVKGYDGLRALAFLGVFLLHAAPRYGFGWGVDLFLVLSAYLLGSRLLQEHERTGMVNIARFYERRVRRIWPLYFLVLGAAFFLVPFSDRAYLLPTALFGANFAPVYFRRWATIWIGPMWSTSLEEQFYAAVPWFARSRRVMRTFAWTMLAASFFGRAATYSVDLPLAMEYARQTVFRLDGLAVGLLLATANLPTPSARAGWGWVLGGAATMFFATRLPMLWVVLVVAAGAGMLVHGARGNALLGNPALAWLGERSYGLYLLHGPILKLLERYWGAGLPLIALPATVALAAGSYRYFERPILDYQRRPRARAVPAA